MKSPTLPKTGGCGRRFAPYLPPRDWLVGARDIAERHRISFLESAKSSKRTANKPASDFRKARDSGRDLVKLHAHIWAAREKKSAAAEALPRDW